MMMRVKSLLHPRLVVSSLLLSIFVLLSSAPASNAQTAGTPVANFCVHEGIFTERIVGCVRDAIRSSTASYLHAFSNYMHAPIVIGLILSIVFIGFKIVIGDSQLKPKLFGTILKIGFVLWLTNDFGGLLDTVFNVMQELQNIVTTTLMKGNSSCPIDPNGDMAVWKRIDCLMGRMFGFGTQAFLYNGLIGMVGAAMFSGALGLQLFSTGLGVMMMMMMMVFRSVYTFLLAYTAVAFLIIMSPLIIPMLLFERTVGMFYKWLNQLIAALIEPMILFAFLAFFFGAMESVVSDFDKLSKGSQDMASKYRSNISMGFGAKIGFDPQQYKDLLGNATPKQRPVEETMSPMDQGGSNPFDILKVTKLDLGANHTSEMTKIITSTLSMIVTVYLMLTVVSMIPGLARGLVGLGENAATGTGMGMGRLPGQKKTQDKMETASNKAIEGAEAKGGGGGLEGIGNYVSGAGTMGRDTLT